MIYTTPPQAVKDAVLQRLGIFYKELTKEQLIEKSGAPQYVPGAIEELLKEERIELVDGKYRLKGNIHV